ncbi:uncharacterized protein LOC132270608 [Cornus florida]|uniref:uncharacterized protein LOC132270608 n=1 Tax=Cornus florida TaxID=4283 RepID=UPI00289B3504|nr:uncharacterized protein LOC132270608 [Cornus florida]
MIGLWNVRGLNRLAMQKEVKAWLSGSSIVLCGLAETRVNSSKFQRLKDKIRNNWSWDNNYTTDAGGRIWCGWDPIRLDVSVLLIRDQMMLLQVEVKGSNTKFFVPFMSAKNTDRERKTLWSDLEDSAQFIDGPWLLLGDWNVIRINEEKKGGRYSNRRIYVKLDKGLMNEEWGQVADGPKPFKFISVWNQQPVVKDLIAELWKTKTSGDPIKRLLYKLKLTKQAVRDWNKDKFGSVYEEAISCRKNLAAIQYQLRDDPLNKRLIQIEKEATNNITVIQEDGVSITDPSIIKSKFVDHFQRAYANDQPAFNAPKEKFIRNKLSVEEIIMLEEAVTREEIKSTVLSMGPDRAPSPDGFTSRFFQHFWSIIGEDFTDAILQFFSHPELGRGSNNTFITLIQKKKDALKVGDYRPISLCNVFYKVIAKILVNRLAKVLGKIVDKEQNAFI